jgi:threonine synthase
MPRFVAVQSEGCAPIVQAYRERKTESTYWADAKTVAFGINVPKALGDFLVLEAIYETSGTAISVNDREILETQRTLARMEGVLVCPEGAATLAAAQQLRAQGWIAREERVLAINTGTGLKYPDVPYPLPPLLDRDATLPVA